MKISFKEAGKVIIFLSLIFFAADVSAQIVVNNDLHPSPTPKKTPKPVRGPKPTGGRRNVTARTPKPKNTPPVNTPVNPQPPSQTPAEIIQRFMNFQQSGSVTARDWESVVTQTNATLQSNPNDATTKAQLFTAQGQLAFIRGDFSNALIQFNAASNALPESALPFYGIGRVYLATKQPNEAETAFERAVKLDKTFALAYKGIGDALTAQGKTKKAQDYFKQAAKIGLSNGSGVVAPTSNPNAGNQNNQTVPSPNQSTSPYDLEMNEARKLTVRKKWQTSLDKLMALSKTNPTADVYIAIGDNYVGMQQWLSAQQAFQKATEISPSSAVGFFRLGTVLFELNEYQAAKEAFEKSLILDQQGKFINRQLARKWADRASEKVKDSKDGKKKKFLGIG